MLQDNHFRAVKVSALMLLAVAAIMYVFQYKRSIDTTYPSKTFSVDGSGDVDVVPDVARFSVSVVSEGGKNVADVQTINTEKMNRVNTFLKDQGVDPKDLRTSQYNVSPRYEYSTCANGVCPPPAISGYTINQTLEVKVRDTSKLGALLSGVVQNGGNTVSDVRFVVDDDTAAKNTARAKAIEEAKKKAQSLAQAGGFKLGRLVSIYDSSDQPTPIATGLGGGAMDAVSAKAAPQPVVEPGTQNTKIQMTLTYEIVN